MDREFLSLTDFYRGSGCLTWQGNKSWSWIGLRQVWLLVSHHWPLCSMVANTQTLILSISGMTVMPGILFSLASLCLAWSKVTINKHPDTGLFSPRVLQFLLEIRDLILCLPVLWFVKFWNLWLCSGEKSLRGLSTRHLVTSSGDVIMLPVPRTKDESLASYKHYNRPGGFKNKGKLQLGLIIYKPKARRGCDVWVGYRELLERLRILHMQFDFQIDGGGEFSLCFVCNLIYQIQDCVHTRLWICKSGRTFLSSSGV